MTARPAVFLDRDGTLVRDLAWGAEPGELELLPGTAPALRALRAAGFALVVVSNQAGVARGLFDLGEARRSAAHLAALLAAAGAPLDGYYVSPYHESAGREPAFSRASEARKPGAGMPRAAAADLDLDLARSWIVGDHPSDVAAGLAAGGRGILLDIGQLGWPTAEAMPAILGDPRVLIARNLPHAADLILATPAASPPAVAGEEAGGRGGGADLPILGPSLAPQTLVRPPPPPDDRAPGEPCPWPDEARLARAEADGRLLAALRRL
jgi:D-glycero-D-manno-heptose 1,7-bisphosphate phosphatase